MLRHPNKPPKGYNPEPFPKGYTQADEDRHLRRMRNIDVGGKLAIAVLVLGIGGGIVAGLLHRPSYVTEHVTKTPHTTNKEKQ
jgi:hypothetical protein